MLARQYRITLDALMRANPNLDPYNLRIGMELCIPLQGDNNNNNLNNFNDNNNNNMTLPQLTPMPRIPGSGSKVSSDSKVYKTQRGDTLTRILDRYEITFAALQSSNPNIDFTGNLEDISLNIPSEDHYRTCPMSGAYIVKNGDTLDSICKKLLMVSDSLLMANPSLTIEDFRIPETKVCLPR